MIFINFKTYRSGTGEQALQMAKLCQQYSSPGLTVFVPVVQAVDLYRVASEVKTEIWVQSADPHEPFKNSGYITPYGLKQSGAAGFCINHSDCPKSAEEIKSLVKMGQENKLKTLIFAKNSEEIRQYDKLGADYVSLEDPKLIASEVAMVDKYKDLLVSLVKEISTSFIIGAGIRTKEHYKKSLNLGASGVVISSQVMESDNPVEALSALTG